MKIIYYIIEKRRQQGRGLELSYVSVHKLRNGLITPSIYPAKQYKLLLLSHPIFIAEVITDGFFYVYLGIKPW
jgi:hypothetical protein